jgi:hypothetical protein
MFSSVLNYVGSSPSYFAIGNLSLCSRWCGGPLEVTKRFFSPFGHFRHCASSITKGRVSLCFSPFYEKNLRLSLKGHFLVQLSFVSCLFLKQQNNSGTLDRPVLPSHSSPHLQQQNSECLAKDNFCLLLPICLNLFP